MNYDEFREQYENQHPASVPQMEIEDIPYPGWLKFATLFMFLAAAFLSAVHTIPVVYAAIPPSDIIPAAVIRGAAYSSIVAFELGILLSAFLMLTKSSMKLAWVLLSTMFVGTLVANIYSISQTSDSNILAHVVTAIFGAGVPIIALAAGKLFVNIYTSEFNARKRAKTTYQEDMKQWDATINRAWTLHQKQEEKKAREREREQAYRSNGVHEVHERFMKPVKRTPARERVHEHLNQHPEDVELSINDLAHKLDLSNGLVSEERNNWKAERDGVRE